MTKQVFDGVTYNVRQGTAGKDRLIEGSGNDWIKGGAGDDTILDVLGNNLFDGGSGSDTITGGIGQDIFIHRMGENIGAADRYEGAIGTDTLRLELTSAEWARADVQADIAAFLAHTATTKNKLLSLVGLTSDFSFKSMNLKLSNIEKLEVYVDGVELSAKDDAVKAVGETLSVTSAMATSIDLLANDVVPDRVASISLGSFGSAYGQIALAPSLMGGTQTASLTFTPNAAYAALKAGETKTETVTYTITDVDGDRATATATLKIVGVNDAPEAVADFVSTDEDAAVTIDVLANDKDIDGDALTLISVSAPAGKGSASIVNGKVRFDPGPDFQSLGAGQSETVELTYSVSDPTGAVSSSKVQIVISGREDGPEYVLWDSPRDYLIGNQYIETTANYSDIVVGDYQYYRAGVNYDPQPGSDTIVGSGSTIAGDAFIFRPESNYTTKFGDDVILIKGSVSGSSIFGDYFIEPAIGNIKKTVSYGDDILDASDSGAAITIYGDAFLARLTSSGTELDFGHDDITGSSFNDVIYGDVYELGEANPPGVLAQIWYGDDKIEGGRGDDFIYGDGNNAPMATIEFGDDTFIFALGSGHDTIADFGRGADKLDVSGYGFTSITDLSWQIVGQDTIVTLAPNATVRLLNYASLSANDFLFA